MKIELSPEHIQIIASALGELPFKVAAPVLNHLQAQMNAAMTALAVQPPAPEAPAPAAKASGAKRR